jgi:NADPH:quinone reductase-like Zn-dependent oxidoreductase
LTAYECLSVRPNQVKPGSSVFINGGSSSVGQMAVQIAKNMGASDIAASCSKENHAIVRELGATDLYDYKASPLTEQLKSSRSGRPFDLIVDAVGSPELFTSSTSYLKPDGLFVTISANGSTAAPMGMAMFRPTFLGGTPRAFKLIMTDWNKGHFADMLRWQSESQYMAFSMPSRSIS